MQTVLVLTDSIAAVGTLLICRTLPLVILGTALSPFADRWNKKAILITSDIARALIVLAFVAAVFWRNSGILFVGSVFFGISGALFNPTKQALLPLIADRKI